ncbi:MAG: ABC transporter ATP-binding protein [Solirubrobacterales bacterium]
MKIISSNKITFLILFILFIIQSVITYKLPYITQGIFDRSILDGKLDLLINYITIYMIFNLIVMFIDYFFELSCSKLTNKRMVYLREELFNKLSKKNGEFFSNIKTGSIFKIATSDTSQIASMTVDIIVKVLPKILLMFIIIYVLFETSQIMAIVCISFQIIMVFLQLKLSVKVEGVTKELHKGFSGVSDTINEYLSSIKEHIISNTNKYLLDIIKQNQKISCEKIIDHKVAIGLNGILMNIISLLNYCVIIVLGTYFISRKGITLGSLMIFMSYTGQLKGYLMILINTVNDYKSIKVLQENYDYIMNMNDIESYVASAKSTVDINNISFKNVSFSYEEDRIVYEDFNLSIDKMDIVGICGKSGEGKSTLINLLCRFWETNEGEILVSGVPIKDIEVDKLRDEICIVSQNVVLINDTIRNNIQLSQDYSEGDIIDILKKVELYEYICKLPNGIDTYIGERGVKLSGGQQQRIALARALMNKSSVLILDEATSAIDNIIESSIFKNIRQILKERTTIIIAHKLKTLEMCDNIIVVDNGRVVERGKYDDLLKRKGKYYELYHASTSENINVS